MPSKDKQLPDLLINGRTLNNETDRDNNAVSRDLLGNVSEAWSSSPGSPTDSESVEQFKEMNRQLVITIQVLKYKLKVDKNERENVIEKLVQSSNQELKKKDQYLERLRLAKQEKDTELENRTEENRRKNKELIRYDLYVADLQKEVDSSKVYADELQCQLDELRKTPLQTAQEQSDLDKKIAEMREEIETMKTNLATLENELTLANEKIEQQGSRLRLMVVERGNAELMFKESMEKATRTMRNEIEKVRDVMDQQYREMREIRNESEATRKSLQDILYVLTTERAPMATQVSVQPNNKLPHVSPSLAEQKKLHQKQQGRKKI